MDTINKKSVTAAQIDQLEQLSHELPVETSEMLQAIASCLRQGDDIVAFAPADTITPTAAAQQLRMSRSHLYKLLDEGVIPFHRVGRDRRIHMSDFVVFVQRRDSERRSLAESFAARQQTEDAAARELAEFL